MTTVGQLIKLLSDENPDEPVIFEYYLKNHFGETVSDNVWSEVAEQNDDILTNTDAYLAIQNTIETYNK